MVEVSASTASLDANEKAETYRRAGVGEYLLWRTEDGAVDWFLLEGGRYKAIKPGPNDFLEGRAFPGLRLDRPALLRGEPKAVLDGLGD